MATPYTDHRKLIGGILIIAGMNIGVGMLALPVVTVAEGFIPTVFLYIACALFMIACARLILEACTWLPRGAHLISISKTFLGKPGAIICWIVFLFLFYCLLIAHLAAGAGAIGDFTRHIFPHGLSAMIYLLIFAPFVYLGTGSVERLTVYLMGALVITFLFFVFIAIPHLDLKRLEPIHWSQSINGIPDILTAFGFQILVPTLYTFMEKDHKTLRKSIWFGTLIPLVLYLIWEFFTIGLIPKENLLEAKHLGQSAIEPLQKAIQSDSIKFFAETFATLAMTTSFLGISIAFIDFLADGTGLKKHGLQHCVLMLLVFLVPLTAVILDHRIFILALDLSGSIGQIILYGMIPTLCVWSGRYVMHRPLNHQFVPGGKKSLIFLFILALLCVSTQFL